MPLRLIPLDQWPEIPVGPAMTVVGRDPTCDARLESILVSRRHCSLRPVGDEPELEVRDLGSTHGIWINGLRVLLGRLRPGDELAIAHIRYTLDVGPGGERSWPGGPRAHGAAVP
jgi:pSer/pThr/pTyr-binding forkhead associated (FHA) protein